MNLKIVSSMSILMTSASLRKSLIECIFSPPLDYMQSKIPGLGEIDWSAFISALYDIGYDGPVCVEVEDRAFWSNVEAVLASIRINYRYISQFLE
jgi:hypothetical protein